MVVIQAAGGSFLLDERGLRDDSPFVAAARTKRPSYEALPLLLVVDPVESAPGTADVALDILNGMSVYLRHTMEHGIRDALVAAFKIANERVYAENHSRHGMRRMYLGLTCVVLDKDELYVAQTAPSQLLVWQEGDLHAIPALSTWSADVITETFSDLSYPLGFRESIEPRVSYSRCAPGDVVAVVSWPIAKQLALRSGLDGIGGAGDFVRLLSELGHSVSGRAYHGAVFELEAASVLGNPGYAERRRSSTATSVSAKLALDVPHASGESRRTVSWESNSERFRGANDSLANVADWVKNGSREGRRFDTLESGQTRWTGTEPFPHIHLDESGGAHSNYVELSSSPRRFSVPPAASGPASVQTSGNSYTRAGTGDQTRAARPAHRGRIVEIFAGLLLSLTAAVVGVWQVTKRDRPIHGPRDDGTLGLPHLQRWADTYHPPRFEGIRRVSPRFQLSGIAMIAVVVTIVVLGGALAYSQITGRLQERTANLEQDLQTIVAVRSQAESAPDTQAAYESLIDAESALETMAASTGDDDMLDRIHDEQRAVSQMLDSLTAVERLTSVQVMGTVPAAPEGVTPRLFKGNGRVFVLTDGLYELDQTTGSLIQLLGPGDEVGGSPIGTLLAADWGEDRPIVVDAQNAFIMDPATGEWHRRPLGIISPTGYTDVAAIASFDRNLYFLTPESGQILKFDSLDFSVPPEDWNAGAAKDALTQGVDMVVDGSIHVAAHDGQVLSFFRSAHEGTVMAQPLPPVDAVAGLRISSGGQHFYLVNESDGRIVCIDREGKVLRQFIPAAGAPSLEGLTDVVVDEASGIAHAIAGNTLYLLRLTLPAQ